ncbi:glutathione S-transferase [Aliiroseovarius halocynthiae]|uniref:Glutathione S-transferase family protein n=1 Tax=Aliiroseovarius halocynthiae TaxID=985055 RepID=A0A545SUZ8_9RHOB|nr:glutathione S-transferase family protein [Aliiroseovarius halocynthiae]TQV68785.1 glutathione S-transferase family protein [Aliiroseovarius halocynthiae]SMR71211.1 glutathione S-transferase [Aliiroseovarius halocynthiae]
MLKLHYAPDNASLIIRLVLEELGTPYETVLVDRASNAQHSAAYLKVNPMGTIPALETPDGVVFETAAILMWLVDRAGQMAPAVDSPDRGAFLSWMMVASNGMQTDLRQHFYAERFTAGSVEDHRRIVSKRLQGHLDRYEALLGAKRSWFGGETPTALDYYVAVPLRWFALYLRGDNWFDLNTWPRLKALAQRIEARPAMQAAIIAEGLGQTPLSAPSPANPPEGAAL